MTIDRTAVSRVLDQIAAHLELKGENPFKIRAFRNGARTVSGLGGEPSQWLADGTLDQVHGIGAGSLDIHATVNWTNGCIALTNEQVVDLAGFVVTGTAIRIR